jgi:Flp pilus assembly protein TadD
MRSHEDAGQTKGWIGMNQPVTATTDVYRLWAFGRPAANAARRVSRLGVVLLQCGWVLAIVGCAEPVLPTGSERSDASLVRLGDDLRRNGDLPGPTGFYQAALNRDARDPVALQRLGEALLAAGDPVRAEQAFRAALLSGSAGPEAKRGLAAALLSEGRAADALPLLAADGAGEDVRMLRDRGVALDLLGRPAEAQAAYRAGLRLAPLDAALHGNLALSLAISGDSRGAVEEMRAALASPRPDARQEANAVLVLALIGQADAAWRHGVAAVGKADTTALMERAGHAQQATTLADRAAALGVMPPPPSTAQAPGSGPAVGSLAAPQPVATAHSGS